MQSLPRVFFTAALSDVNKNIMLIELLRRQLGDGAGVVLCCRLHSELLGTIRLSWALGTEPVAEGWFLGQQHGLTTVTMEGEG